VTPAIESTHGFYSGDQTINSSAESETLLLTARRPGYEVLAPAVPAGPSASYDGVIWMDPADGSIRRLRRTSTGLPAEMPVSLIQSDIEFSPATVGTEKISMLPVRIMERICEHSEEACTEISSVVQGYSAPNAEMNH